MRSCRVGEREIVVCHTKNGVFALDNVCTHAFARMSEGYLKGTRLTCPLHGATFDVCTGAALAGPATIPLTTYPTRIVEGRIEVELPVEVGTK
jgi:3-phenylpropionate/trans-cinnamate dioxygenase ferredoxin subunit